MSKYDDKPSKEQIAKILKKAEEHENDTCPLVIVEEIEFNDINREETQAILKMFNQEYMIK